MVTKSLFYPKVCVWILFLFFCSCQPWEGVAGGISTSFTEVTIRNLYVGKGYAMGQRLPGQIRVKNTGETPIELRVDIVVPSRDEVKEGYEPIPDSSWLEVSKDYFLVEPSGRAIADLIVTIPPDRAHINKKYEAYVWSHTVGKESGSIALGLMSKVFLEISGEEKDIKGEWKDRFAFSISPEEIRLDSIRAGEVFDIGRALGKTLEVSNKSEYPHFYTVDAVTAKKVGVQLDTEYEDCPEPGFLKFNPTYFELKKGKKTGVAVYLSFPDEQKYRGKKYVFLVRVRLIEDNLVFARYLKIYVALAE